MSLAKGLEHRLVLGQQPAIELELQVPADRPDLRLDHHHPLPPEPHLQLPVVGHKSGRRAAGAGRCQGKAVIGTVEVHMGVGGPDGRV